MEAYIAARTELQTNKRFSILTPKQLDRIARVSTSHLVKRGVTAMSQLLLVEALKMIILMLTNRLTIVTISKSAH